MIVAALAFLAGVLAVQQLPILPAINVVLVGCGVAAIMAWRRYWYALFFVLGLLWALVFAMMRLSNPLPSSLEGIDIAVTGIIVGLPEYDAKQVRFDVIVTHANQPLPHKLRLNWHSPDQVLKAGEQRSFTVRLKRPHGTFNVGGFDYERWLFSQGIGATGSVRPYPKPVLLSNAAAWFNPDSWRQTISDSLAQQLAHTPNFALIKALAIGDGSAITQAQWTLFRHTGTTHLVVISGSHIGLVAGLVYFLVLKLWAWTGRLMPSPQKIAAVAALSSGFCYAELAGFSVPTQRAVVMLAVVMLALIQQRNIQPFNTLALALFAVLIFDPFAVLAAGFWLSFFAVGIISYAATGRLGGLGYFRSALTINWVTSVGLSPLLLFFFQQVSLIAPIANLIAVPVISLLLVPLTLLSISVMLIIPSYATPLFNVLDLALQGLMWLLHQLAALPIATISHAQPSLLALAYTLPALMLLLAPAGMPARALGLFMLLPLCFTEVKKPALGTVNMTLLDVGQGLAVTVQTTHHWLVYDTGAKFSGEGDIGLSVLLPFLQHHGVEKIDQLVLSHGDNDHIGGAVSLMNGITTAHLLTSVPQQLPDYMPVRCQAGQSWQWDGVSFTVLSPPAAAFSSDNDNSCVLQIKTAQQTILLTGDIEASAEAWLVDNYGQQLQSNILIAPHHGSKTSSSPAFLAAVQPDYVLIPAGYRNQFGHPHKTVLARYHAFNAVTLNTADSGAINVKLTDTINITTLRDTDRHYWHNMPD